MNQTSEQETQKQELITIAGGVEIEITLRDGTKETVKVRQIPVSKIQDFVAALGDEAKAVDLYCGKDKGWSDTLELKSVNDIAEKGQQINLPFFEAWWTRQAKWRKSLNTGAVAELEAKLVKLIDSRLGNSPQASPSTTG